MSSTAVRAPGRTLKDRAGLEFPAARIRLHMCHGPLKSNCGAATAVMISAIMEQVVLKGILKKSLSLNPDPRQEGVVTDRAVVSACRKDPVLRYLARDVVPVAAFEAQSSDDRIVAEYERVLAATQQKRAMKKEAAEADRLDRAEKMRKRMKKTSKKDKAAHAMRVEGVTSSTARANRK